MASSSSAPVSPNLHVNDWSDDNVQNWLASLGLAQYAGHFRENGINGEVLVLLDDDALKDVGVQSVGQRLALLGAIYKLKDAHGIVIEEGDYVPPSEAFADSSNEPLSLVQMAFRLRDRDDRIRTLEAEVGKLADYLSRFQHDFASVCRMIGVRNPSSEAVLPAVSVGKQEQVSIAPPSESNVDGSLQSPAAHQTVESPTVPAPEHAPASASSAPTPNGNSTIAVEPEEASAVLKPSKTPTGPVPVAEPSPSMSAPLAVAAPAATPSPTASTPSATPTSTTAPSTGRSNVSGRDGSRSAGGRSGESSSDNPYKSFRVTLDDPCYKVLPAALKKYKINDDWRQYALFICYGNTERCLSYDEKPLLLFQKLKEAKQNPVFMLRHIRDVKSPIAIASAKAAARKGTGKDTAKAATGRAQATSIKSPGSGKVAETIARFGSAKPPSPNPGGDGKAEGTHAKTNEGSESNGVGSGDGAAPPRSTIVGPASQLPSSDGPNTYSIAIYPYVSERDDEFDVNVGDTFIVLSKAKGWWVVQRDSLGEGIGDVEEIEGEDNSREVEIRSGWVPAGCLLETSQPLAKVMTPAVESPMAAAQAQGPNAANASHGGAVSSAASTPTGPTTPHGDVDMATAPIPPSVITSTSTPGIMLMDYKAADDKLSLNKDDKLRVFKRYNHWSYCVQESDGHARGWVPSWYIGKIGSSSSSSSSRHGTGAGPGPSSAGASIGGSGFSSAKALPSAGVKESELGSPIEHGDGTNAGGAAEGTALPLM